MKMMVKKLFTLALVSLGMMSSALAFDPNDVALGRPAFAGTGCPWGSASVALSPDAQELSILFDNYAVDAGGSTGRTIARKNCTIAIPVHVPQGYSVSLIKVDYRGFNSLPAGAYSKFDASYFFAGSAGPTQSKTFYGSTEGEYLLTSNLLLSDMVWSRCGDSVILRAATSLYLKNTNPMIEALSTLDSVDVSAGLIYRLSWKQC